MANYNETTVSGSKWRRARSVIIDNTFGSTPVISFSEEDIVRLENTVLTQGIPPDVPRLWLNFDPGAVITLLDPTTGLPSGSTMTHRDLYVTLNSLYMQLAAIRDNPPVVVIPTIGPPPPPLPIGTV